MNKSKLAKAAGRARVRLVPVGKLKPHPRAGVVPEMTPAELAELEADVRLRGVLQPLEVVNGDVVLDGRSRLTVAKAIGLDAVPVVGVAVADDEQVVYMIRAATLRRHLTDGQRAMLAEEERAYLADRGRDRQRAGVSADGAAGGRGRKKPRDRSGPGVARARASAAAANGISERKVRQAQLVKRHDPALAERVKNGRVKLPQAVRAVQLAQRQQARAALAAEAPAVGPGEQPWRLIVGDSTAWLAREPEASADLVFADPPFNIGYTYRTYHDRLDDAEYLDFSRAWIGAVERLLKPGGSFYLAIGDDYAAELLVEAKRAGFALRRWIVWHYTFGQQAADNFASSHVHILYLTKGPPATFNAEAVRVASARQTTYGDARANPAGKLPDDVWVLRPQDAAQGQFDPSGDTWFVPRVNGTFKERVGGHGCQMPLAVLERIVLASSNPGDLVVDPFSGTATTGRAAVRHGRRYLGVEIDPEYSAESEVGLRAVLAGEMKTAGPSAAGGRKK